MSRAHTRSTLAPAACVAVAVLTLSGCGSDAAETPLPSRATASAGQGEHSESQSPDKPIAAPKKFAADPVPITLAGVVETNMAGEVHSRFTLDGQRAYGTTMTSLGAVDLSTGETLWETTYPGGNADEANGVLVDDSGPGAPLVAEGGKTVYAAAKVHVEGSGTAADHEALEVMAADTSNGEVLWSANVTVPADVPGGNTVRVLDARDGKIVVTLEANLASIPGGMIAVIDEATHKTLWSATGTAHIVAGQTVLATADPHKSQYPQFTGFDLATGKTLWSGKTMDSATGTGFNVTQANGTVLATIAPYSGADPWTETVDPATGKRGEKIPGDLFDDPQPNGDLILDESDGGIKAITPDTMKTAWALPQGSRMAPSDVVTFAGLIYGRVDDGNSVILDGKTGNDVTGDIPGSFIAVNEYGALMLHGLEVFFAPAIA